MESTSTHTTIPSFLSLVCWLLDCLCPESPAFSGVAVVELLKRPSLMKARSGSVQVVAELARELSFKDPQPPQTTAATAATTPSTAVATNPPPSIRSLRFLLPNFVFPQIEAEMRAEQRKKQQQQQGGADGEEQEAPASIPDWIKGNVPDILLPWSVFSGNPPPPSPAEE